LYPFCTRELLDRVPQVALVDDVVPVEHGARLVAGELHRGLFRTPARTRLRTAEVSSAGSLLVEQAADVLEAWNVSRLEPKGATQA
jgi:hypothetical protein